MAETVEPGKWYFQIKCHFCEREIALMEDQSKGVDPVEFEQKNATVDCPHCGKSSEYLINEVQTGPGHYKH